MANNNPEPLSHTLLKWLLAGLGASVLGFASYTNSSLNSLDDRLTHLEQVVVAINTKLEYITEDIKYHHGERK